MKEYILDENGFLVPRELWNEAHEVGKTPPTVEGRGRQSFHLTGNSIKKKRKPTVPCPVCGIHITQRGLETHIRAAHPHASQSAITKVAQAPSSRNPVTSKKQQKKPASKPLPDAPQTTIKFVECTICRQSIRSDRLQRHMLKVHSANDADYRR
jgi:hypothetical protein